MKINAFELKTKIADLRLHFPELENDEDLRLDVLEGETELLEILTIVADNIRSAASMQDAIDLRLNDLKSRKERFGQRETGWRALAKQLMDAASFRKITLPELTLSIRAGVPSVQIIDQAFLPDAFWRVKREPNLSQIKTALKDGQDVPGAVLNNAPDTLAIHSK